MGVSRRGGLALLAPLTAILAGAIVVPAAVFFVYSFFDFELLEPRPAFDLAHYGAVLGDELYRRLAWNTIRIAVPTTILAVTGGFALAYWIALCKARTQTILIALVVVSMLASYLARVYAWRTLLGEQGILASVIQATGLGHGAPGFLLFSRVSVVIGQVNFLMPFSALVLFSGLSGIPATLRDAGRDLGARPATVFRHVTLPLVGPALLSAIAVTFFVAAGDYLTPLLLGGSQGTTYGTVISDQLKLTGNYPLGAALAFTMVAAFALVYGAVRLTMRSLALLPQHGGAA
ncbi:MAG TPA: ABC transporter permease [Conexibacter sp.]|nr:ABC transporter permease [Conexibacter sp.]